MLASNGNCALLSTQSLCMNTNELRCNISKVSGSHGSAGMLRHVALVRTDVSEECTASIITVNKTSELGTLAVTSNRMTLLI
jgi:hypothetical protein